MQFRNMARPTLFDRPLTAAERMRLHRARKRGVVVAQSQRTVRQLAEEIDVAERTLYYMRAFERYRLIEFWGGKEDCSVSLRWLDSSFLPKCAATATPLPKLRCVTASSNPARPLAKRYGGNSCPTIPTLSASSNWRRKENGTGNWVVGVVA